MGQTCYEKYSLVVQKLFIIFANVKQKNIKSYGNT